MDESVFLDIVVIFVFVLFFDKGVVACPYRKQTGYIALVAKATKYKEEFYWIYFIGVACLIEC